MIGTILVIVCSFASFISSQPAKRKGIAHLLYDLEAKLIISMNYVLINERKDGHNNMDDRLSRILRHFSDKKQSLAVCLRILGNYETGKMSSVARTFLT